MHKKISKRNLTCKTIFAERKTEIFCRVIKKERAVERREGWMGFQYSFVYQKLFNLKTFQTYLSSHIRSQLFWFRTSGNHFAWAWLHQGPRTSINIWLLTTPAREGHVTCGSFLLLCRFLSGEIIVRSLLACGRLFVCREKRPYSVWVFTYRSAVTFDILVMYRFHRY